MQYCPRCGERVEPEDAYCFECGTALDRSGDERSDRGRDSRRERGPDSGHERGRTSPGQRTATRSGTRRDADGSRGRVESLTTLRVAAVGVALALLETGSRVAVVLLAPEMLTEQAAELGVTGEIDTTLIAFTAGFGAFVAVALAGACVYYYRQGYVDRRFYWTLVGASVLGFLVGSGLSFLITAGVGAYGLLVVLRRQGSKEPQATSP